MLTLDQIKSYYEEGLHRFPRFLLREYLQHKILEIVFNSEFATGLSFLGGTCLRIIHGNQRFSEDLDFDNLALSDKQFAEVAEIIRKGLEEEGYSVEIRTVMKGAWHCYIRFPRLLYDEGLTGHIGEKILIQLDTEPQEFDFEPERVILNKYDVFTTVLTTPLPLLMAQKCYAVMNRPRKEGRDFYDLAFLMARNITPDYNYLNAKLAITEPEKLRQVLLGTCSSINLKEMAADVEPFLFRPSDVGKVDRFDQLLKGYAF